MTFDTPHLGFPFSPGFYREQDDDEEIMDCAEVLLRTPKGSRVELPEYGLSSQVFKMGGADLVGISATLVQWDDRAPVAVTEQSFQDLIETVRVEVYVGA